MPSENPDRVKGIIVGGLFPPNTDIHSGLGAQGHDEVPG